MTASPQPPPALTPSPGANQAQVRHEFKLAFIAVVGLILSGIAVAALQGWLAGRQLDKTISAQAEQAREDNEERSKDVAVAISAQADDALVNALRDQRREAFAEFLRNDQELKRLEFAWLTARSTSGPGSARAQEAKRLVDLTFPEFRRAAPEAELVATCKATRQVLTLVNAHRDMLASLADVSGPEGAELRKRFGVVRVASNRFLRLARADIRLITLEEENTPCKLARLNELVTRTE